MKFKVGDIIAPRDNLENHIELLYNITDDYFWLAEDDTGLEYGEIVAHIRNSEIEEGDKLISLLERGKLYHTAIYYSTGHVKVAAKLTNTEITRKLYSDRIIEEEKDYLIVAMS